MKDPRLVAQMMALEDPRFLEELWLRYWANGGSVGQAEFGSYLQGPDGWDPFELRILAWQSKSCPSKPREADGKALVSVAFKWNRPTKPTHRCP